MLAIQMLTKVAPPHRFAFTLRIITIRVFLFLNVFLFHVYLTPRMFVFFPQSLQTWTNCLWHRRYLKKFKSNYIFFFFHFSFLCMISTKFSCTTNPTHFHGRKWTFEINIYWKWCKDGLGKWPLYRAIFIPGCVTRKKLKFLVLSFIFCL